MNGYWIVLFGLLFASGEVSGAEVDVWTFNLRYASASGPNSWEARRPVMKALWQSESPDIVGTQEGLYAQLRDLDADLPDYDWIGTGRDGGSRGEFMAIFYRRDRFEPLAYDHRWLSDTPLAVGSKSWGNTVVRMVTWVEFRDRRDGSRFLVVNTHFDHESEPSRVKSALFLSQLVNEFDATLPVLITGDFNAPATASAAYATLVQSGIIDTWTAATSKSAAFATYHGYHTPQEDGPRIDWILARGASAVLSATIHTESRDGQYPSDHFPVSAKIRLGAEKRE
ncbi:MAG: endonuclease/exonuclease/phosphatase family protein [Planctomycetota bacterium]